MNTFYGLLGKKLGYSRSPELANRWFAGHGINAEYRIFELDDICYFKDLLNKIPTLKGLNVTIPYKTSVIPMLDRLTPEAEAVGAVNAILIKRHGLDENMSIEAIGHNTDADGFTFALGSIIESEAGMTLTEYQSGRALVLGTGGASKAVCHSLKRLGFGLITKVSRRQGGADTTTYARLTPEIVNDSRIIVNATPLGTFPDIDAAPDIPYGHIAKGTICFDLVYNPSETLFMRKSRAAGAIVSNGLVMLERQALLSLDFWGYHTLGT